MTIKQFLIKDNNNLDFIRIICASFVIIGHSYSLFPVASGQEDIIKILTGFTYSGALSVKIFFFISGMLVTDSLLRKQDIRSFLISRAFRMLPALLFLLLVTAFVIGPLASAFAPAMYFSSMQPYTYVAKNMAFFTNYLLPGVFHHNYFKNIVNGSLWSLRLEVRCYLALLGFFVIAKDRKWLFNLLIAAIFIDAIFRLNIIGRGTNTEHSLLPISFALGALLAVNKEWIVIDYRTILPLAILTGLLWHTQLCEIVFIITVCFGVIALCRNEYIRKVKIRYDISYGIYLWGFLVQQAIMCFSKPENVYLFMFYSLILSSILGFISFAFIEKRFITLGRSLDKRIGAAKAPAAPSRPLQADK